MNRTPFLAILAASLTALCLLSGCSNAPAQTQPTAETLAPTQSAAETLVQTPPTESAAPAETYADNFSADPAAVEAFAQKIQSAVAEKDLEKLADLTAFPVYVGLPDAGVVESREDFLKLGSDAVLTDALMDSIRNADLAQLQPSMAGFSLCSSGNANINFGVVNGVLAINGINY